MSLSEEYRTYNFQKEEEGGWLAPLPLGSKQLQGAMEVQEAAACFDGDLGGFVYFDLGHYGPWLGISLSHLQKAGQLLRASQSLDEWLPPKARVPMKQATSTLNTESTTRNAGLCVSEDEQNTMSSHTGLELHGMG